MEELPYNFGIFAAYWIVLAESRRRQDAPATDPRLGLKPRLATDLHPPPLRDTDIALGRTNTVWRTWLEHNTFDDYWRQLSLTGHFHKIDLPVLHITGWFDGDQWGELFYWHGMIDESPAADRQWLVCRPLGPRRDANAQAASGRARLRPPLP